MANKSLRCVRAEGGMYTKSKKTTSEILSVMGRYELMDLLRAKRGGELNHVINNQSQLSRENSGEIAFELDGIDEGKSPSLMSSIEDREDLDFHDESFVHHSEVSSNSSSSYKSLKIHLGGSSSSDALALGSPNISSSSGDQMITLRPSSDVSTSSSEEEKEKEKRKKLSSPKGVSVGGGRGGGESKISKFPGPPPSSGKKAAAGGGGGGTGGGSARNSTGDAQSFFTRAITGIRSGSQSNVLSGGGTMASVSSSSSGSGSGSSSSGGKQTQQQEPEDKQLDFFSRALTGIRSSPQRASEEDKKGKAKKLENKLQLMSQKSNKKFDQRLMETTPVDTKPLEMKKTKSKEVNAEVKENSNVKKKQGNAKANTLIGETEESDVGKKETSGTPVTKRDELMRRGSSQLLAIEAVSRRSSLKSPSAKKEKEKGYRNGGDGENGDDTNYKTGMTTPINTKRSANTNKSNNDDHGDDDDNENMNIDVVNAGDICNDNNKNEHEDNNMRDDVNISNFTDVKFNIDKSLSEDVSETDEFDITQQESSNSRSSSSSRVSSSRGTKSSTAKPPSSSSSSSLSSSSSSSSSSLRPQKQEVVSAAANRRLKKEYSYEDLRRSHGKSPQYKHSSDGDGDGGSPRASRTSVHKQFPAEVLSVFADREELLMDDEFEKIFGMTKEKFKALPKWRRQEMKKRHKLF